MKYQAVIFDLFGTLIDGVTREMNKNVLTEIASIMALPFDDFLPLWISTSAERNTGFFPTFQANMEYICGKLGIRVDGERIEEAARFRLEHTARVLTPRPDAVAVLTRLRAEGYKTGLVSNCESETPLAWVNTPFPPLFDVTVFSSSAGVAKPDPRIYRMATGPLGVNPGDCLYVGDGDSNELTGASQTGMHPVLIRAPYEPADMNFRKREDWPGPGVSSLTEVLGLL